MNDELVQENMVGFDLIAESFKPSKDTSFSELKVDNESKGKGKVTAISTKRSKIKDKPPLHSSRAISAHERANSSIPSGSILKMSGSFTER